jgi:2-polyprenyl-3-methyl-5-hydroxy-6-metoxy-1,4-benzoquinol methylase
MAADWLAGMPDTVAQLEAAARPRIADVGCGQGFSTLAIAKAFLGAHVDGLDLDPASIADARRHAAEAGLDGRVRFIEADAAELATRGPYELILILEALHDMSCPLDALRAASEALVYGGTVLVAALGTVCARAACASSPTRPATRGSRCCPSRTTSSASTDSTPKETQ